MKFTILASLGFLATASAFAQQSCNRPSFTALNMASPAEFVDSEIESNDVVVFSKSYCPFCTKTKELFDSLNVEYAVHELDQMGDEGPELQMALFKKTEQKSVPNVFVKQQHIGGNDDTQAAAAAGKLQELLGL